MSMHIDFKVTLWERVYVPKGKEEKVKELIKKGLITNGDELYNWFIENSETGSEDLINETLYDTTEQLTPEENGGSSTIEAFIDNDIVYENGE